VADIYKRAEKVVLAKRGLEETGYSKIIMGVSLLLRSLSLQVAYHTDEDIRTAFPIKEHGNNYPQLAAAIIAKSSK